MWELYHKEGGAPKNWYFWSVLLEETHESLLDCKEIQTANPKGSRSWIFFGWTDVEGEAPILWPPYAKCLIEKDPDSGKDWRWEDKGMTEDEMVGWHHRLDGHESEWALGVGDRQGVGVQLQQPGNQPEGMSGVGREWCSLWLKVRDYMFISSFRFSFILWQKH